MHKVLYVDDEADSEKFASRKDLLADRGIDVDLVSSVEEALRIFNTGVKEYAAVVLDLIMPPANVFRLDETEGGTATGLKLLEVLRGTDKEVPVVVVSIRRKEEVGKALKRYSVAGFVQKAGGTTDRVANAIVAAIEGRRDS